MRLGLGVFNTHIDPGWEGYLTLELKNHGSVALSFEPGDAIAQIVFDLLMVPLDGTARAVQTAQPYRGKYQNQEAGPQPSRQEREEL